MATLLYIPTINLYIQDIASEIAIVYKTNDYLFGFFLNKFHVILLCPQQQQYQPTLV